MIKCPSCNNTSWDPYINTTKNKLITGDQRIGPGNINKVICTKCYLIRNNENLTDKDLELFYGNEYELNTLGREEHYFFTENGPISRSRSFFDWISPHLPEEFTSLLEIGCGEGNLLHWFNKEFPDKSISGIDGSSKAVELAKDKQLNVIQKFISNKDNLETSYDVILAVNVIEHLNDISGFIETLKSSLNSDGRIILTIPVQDYGGYDIFFAEHIWHFYVEHFREILQKNGLELTYYDSNNPINHGIGLFVCKVSNDTSLKAIESNFSILKNKTSKLKNIWLEAFKTIDNKLNGKQSSKIAVFGSGEVFTLYSAFTEILNYDIKICIDETREKWGLYKHGIEIQGLNWLEKNKVDLIILAVNPKYNEIIKSKLIDYKCEVIEVNL